MDFRFRFSPSFIIILSCLTGFSAGNGYSQITEPLLEVVFSHERGYYTDTFDLTLEVPDGFEIYYTLNGDEPSTVSMIYQGPISISSRAGDPNRNSTISSTTYECHLGAACG